MSETCLHCGGDKSARNPAGYCDHLYWPENLSKEARRANGIEYSSAETIERLIKERDEALEALRVLLYKSEKHIFGDECLAERDAARSILSKHEAKNDSN